MKKFEFLEHTADVKMRVFGATLEELFCNAVLGMASLQIPNSKFQILNKSQISNSNHEPHEVHGCPESYVVQGKIQKEIKIASQNLETLLVDFLSEVLTQSDIEHAVFPRAKIKKLTNTEIEAEIFGQKVDKFDEDIKAVTYHGMEVKKVGEHWEAVVLFDI
ncbi:MAG: archease [Patescibacteria group bacterium]